MDGMRLLFDVSVSPRRVIVPSDRVNDVLSAVHNLSHPAAGATLRAVSKCYVWSGMRRAVKEFCRACVSCQRAKIVRHVKAPLQSLPVPGDRFAALHLDIVGPLPQADGYSYLLTIMDRFSRWPEAIPLVDITAQSCARALLNQWIARYGVPLSIVTDLSLIHI